MTTADGMPGTYSGYPRGNDRLDIHYHYLDLAPRGRTRAGRRAPAGRGDMSGTAGKACHVAPASPVRGALPVGSLFRLGALSW
jgi:hypothetical protein